MTSASPADRTASTTCTMVEGYARADFVGTDYTGCLSFRKDQPLLKELGTSTAEGWVRGAVKGEEMKGWFPSEYWSSPEHELRQPVQEQNMELEASGYDLEESLPPETGGQQILQIAKVPDPGGSAKDELSINGSLQESRQVTDKHPTRSVCDLGSQCESVEVSTANGEAHAHRSLSELELQIGTLTADNAKLSRQVYDLQLELQQVHDKAKTELKAANLKLESAFARIRDVLDTETDKCRQWVERIRNQCMRADSNELGFGLDATVSGCADEALEQAVVKFRNAMQGVSSIVDKLVVSEVAEFTSPVVPAVSSRGSSRASVENCDSDHRVKVDFPKAKYLFLVRHAQSRWNDLANDPRSIFTKDHPITQLGEKQASDLRNMILEEYQRGSGSRQPSEQAFYNALFQRCGEEQPLYSSPMLRALQTAHLSFPVEAGWSKIVLLRDAREVRQSMLERDNTGEVVGSEIVKRAQASNCASGTSWRDVDHSDCNDAWWSDQVESEEDINCRLHSLVHQLLEADPSPSCVCVMHSNLIKRFLMRFGSVDGPETDLEIDPLESEPSDSASFTQINYEPGLLQRSKTKKLRNCGMIGLRMVLEGKDWVVKEPCMMFGSQLENDVDVEAGCD